MIINTQLLLRSKTSVVRQVNVLHKACKQIVAYLSPEPSKIWGGHLASSLTFFDHITLVLIAKSKEGWPIGFAVPKWTTSSIRAIRWHCHSAIGHCRILNTEVVVVLLNSNSTKHLQLLAKFLNGEGPFCFGIRTLAANLLFFDDREEYGMHCVLGWVAEILTVLCSSERSIWCLPN